MPLTDNSDSLLTRNLTVEDSLQLADNTPMELRQMAAPPTPPAGSLRIYAKNDGKLYVKNDVDVEYDLTVSNKTVTKIVYIEDPLATDSFPIAFMADDITMTQVRGVTDQGTVDFNIEHRATNTPDVAGADTLVQDLQADSGGASSSSFSDATVPAERWLNYTASAVAGSPGKLWVAIKYTVD